MSEVPFIDIHTHHHQVNDDVIAIENGLLKDLIYEQDENRFFSLGLHPWYLHEIDILFFLEKIDTLSAQKNVLAIGEAGLDMLIDTPLAEQIKLFEQQIEIANFRGKPLIIHCVKAFNELIRLRKNHPSRVPWIIHGFNNNETIARQLLHQDIMLSFGPRLLGNGKKATKISEVVDYQYFFLETDDSGQSINSVYQLASEGFNIDMEDLKTRMEANFRKLFEL